MSSAFVDADQARASPSAKFVDARGPAVVLFDESGHKLSVVDSSSKLVDLSFVHE